MDDLAVAFAGLVGISFVSIADGIINVINSVTGANFGTVTEGLSALGQGLNDAWLALQIVGSMIQTGIANFGLGVQLQVQTFIADLRNTILNATGGVIDIAPTIEMDILATQAQIQANIDAGAAAITTLTAPIMVETTVEASTVDTTGLSTSIDTSLTEVSNSSHTISASTSVTISASSVDASAVTMAVNAAIAQATSAMNFLIGTSNATTGGNIANVTPTDITDVPHALTGANINSDGLVYAHAGERILNPAETSSYGRGGSTTINNINQTNYGESPYEVLRMTRKAARDAAPG